MGWLCWKKKAKAGEDLALSEQLKQDEHRMEQRNKKIQRNYAILRDELYHGIMKPFFAAG